MTFEFTQENKAKFDEILKRYPVKRAAMLPGLWLIQEQETWISPEAMAYLANLLELHPAKVYEVVTFYTMFNDKKIGKYHIQLCRTLPCQLAGCENISKLIQEKLNIKVGETTSDGKFTLTEVECLGSCGTGPMFQLNDDYHENLNAEKVNQILDSLE